MAHWQLGNKEDAQEWYDKAVVWMEEYKPGGREPQRFRTEAEQLLGITTETPEKPSAAEKEPAKPDDSKTEPNSKPKPEPETPDGTNQ